MTSSWFFILQLYRLLGLCHYAHYYLQHTAHSRCASQWTSVCFVSLLVCPVLSSTVCPLSVITTHCTVLWFCVTVSTVVFYSLSTVSTSHCTVCCFCVTINNAVFYSLSVVCIPLTIPPFCVTMSTCVFYNLSAACFLTMYNLFILSLCRVLNSTVCPLSVRIWQCTVSWFCFTMSTPVSYGLPNICIHHTLPSVVLCNYVHCHFYLFVHTLSTSDCTSVGSVSLCPLLSFTKCPLFIYLTL